MSVATINLLAALPDAGKAEVTENLLVGNGVRLERIVSLGQATPEGIWYDQDMAEWVVLLSGRARLTIFGEPVDRELAAGDAVYLPAHCRHRVAWTDPRVETVWLALFVADEHCLSLEGPMKATQSEGD